MSENERMDDSTAAILAVRSEINAAIARRDAATIGAYLLPTYHVVTARSMHRDGREESVKSWAAMFDRDAAATYGRNPEQVHVNEGWGMAQEHGRWSGTITTREGVLELSGVYAAKWHNTPDGWRLEAEIFTPLLIDRRE